MHEVKLSSRVGKLKHVGQHEANQGVLLFGPHPCPLQGDGRAIHGGDLKASPRQQNGIGPRAAADLQHGLRPQVVLVEHANQFHVRLARVPGRRSLAVGRIPIGDGDVLRLR